MHMNLTLPARAVRAYLFDCDGTIADSMPLHYVAWTRALLEWRCEFPEQLFYSWGGTPAPEIIAKLNERYGLQLPVEQVARRKDVLYLENISLLTAVPQVLEHIERSHGEIPFAVVSGDSRETVT